MFWLLSDSRVQAQPLPQPTVSNIIYYDNQMQPHVLQPCEVSSQEGDNSRGLWFDEHGDVDFDGDYPGVHHPRSWFYTLWNHQVPVYPCEIFMHRTDGTDSIPPAPPCRQFIPLPNPPPPNFGSFDYDSNFGLLWAGSYDGSGHLWYHKYIYTASPVMPASTWWDAFSVDNLFLDSFIHEEAPGRFDGLAVMPDSSLYISSDSGFNLFHLNPNLNDPEKLPDSFILPFTNAGIEVFGDILFLSGTDEGRMYVYSRTGKYPLGYFQVRDTATPANARSVEDLDLRVAASHTWLVGYPTAGAPGSLTYDSKLLQWDVKSFTVDTDNDGVPNIIDNCPTISNPDQLDMNSDGVGYHCENYTLNTDEDDTPNYLDNCPYAFNNKQADADRDGRGDACDDITQCFGGETHLGLADGIVDIAIADLDNDGDGDVVTLHHKRYGGGAFGTRFVDLVAIRWSGSHGIYGDLTEPATYAVATRETSRDLVLADINNDGFIDIAVVHDNANEPSDPDPPSPPDPQVPIAPGVTVLWNDHNSHFGELTHVSLRFEENGEELTSGHPVAMFAIRVDGESDSYPELVVVGNHHFPSGQQGTVTIVRYSTYNGGHLDAGNPVGLSSEGVPIRAIAMPPEVGKPEQDIAMLRSDNKVAIHKCTPGVAPFFDLNGYAAPIIDSSLGQTQGRDLAYGFFRHTNVFDLIVIPDEGSNGSPAINFFLNDPVAQTLTLGNGGASQQLTPTTAGRLWRVIRYPSSPYDGVVVLNEPISQFSENVTQGVQVTRFNSTGLANGTFDVTSREDMVDNSRNPMKAVMALGDVSRSCGRDLLVADHFLTLPALGGNALPGLSFAKCPFDSASRSFERPVPSLPTCAVIADVTGTNGPDLIVAPALDEFLFVAGRVMVFRQTPGIPNRFAFEPDEEHFPRINNTQVTDGVVLAIGKGKFSTGNLPDLVIGFAEANGETQFLQVLRRTSATGFTVMPEIAVANTFQNGQIKALSVADFDNDGDDDVMVLTDDQGQTQGFFPNLFLCRGQAGGVPLAAPEAIDALTLHTGAQLAFARNSVTGQHDLYTLLPIGANPPAVRILHNTSGVFSSPIDLEIPTPGGSTTPPSPVAVATGRMVGYPKPYIACADFANNQVVIFVDFGNGYQLASSIAVSAIAENQPTSIVAADLEADGDDDLIVGFDNGNTISVLTCLGRGHFAPMTLPSGESPRFVTSGDVDGNGLPDILEVGGFEAAESHLRVIFSNCGGM